MYEDIKSQFREVIAYSQCISSPWIDDLFAHWEKSKAKFIERFGGLIYEWPNPIEFHLDSQTKKYRIMEFANQVNDTYHNPDLAHFIDENLDSFFDNRVSNTTGRQIPEGMKLIKAFKFFEDDKKVLRNLQDMASILIQENKVVGTLCFSVHPLDFLSSSENTYNWRSCHALDGEYRAGNLSYMVDTTTFMVYLKGADDVILAGFGPEVKWNSKKWRMLIHTAEDDKIMFAGRQYPFSSFDGITQVLNIYNNLMQQPSDNPFGGYRRFRYNNWRADYVNGYVPYDAAYDTEPVPLDDKYIVFNNQLVGLHDVVKQGPGAMNYNDILCSTCYEFPYYAIYDTWCYESPEQLRNNPIIVGGEITCLHCGQAVVRNPETMRCDDCEMEYGYEENDVYGSCSCCGRRIYLDDTPYVGRYDEPVCDSCFQERCFVCDNCGSAYFKEDANYITYDDGDDAMLCPHCYENAEGEM